MATAIAPDSTEKPRQNWILNGWLDYLFIIGTPILALIWALSFVQWFGPNHGPEAVWLVFMVFNIGHHLPTFIRIYGDLDLLKRFRWQLLLGPIMPFTLAMWAVWTFIEAGATVSDLMLISMLLLLWDPWHFVMQHYGFMRIYDRPNRAPRKIAARMDLTLCLTWFVYIMLAAEWLPDILYKAHIIHGFDVVLWYTLPTKTIIESMAFVGAIAATIGYIVYLAWCKSNNYFISWHKIALMLITFSIMFLTYVKNPLMDKVAVGWTFYAGFATLGMVHVTQYLAIVWKYNRGLAKRGKDVRLGLFLLFGRAGQIGLVVAIIYACLCLLYGIVLRDDLLTVIFAWLFPPVVGTTFVKWLNGLIAATLFTSTLLHYYYDGFIWKIRHKENIENLDLESKTVAEEKANETEARENEATTTKSKSWWDAKKKASSPAAAIAKHAIYFGVPMVVLMWSHFASFKPDSQFPYRRLREVSTRLRTRMVKPDEIKAILASARKRLRIEKAMAVISPKAKHFLYAGDLIEAIGTSMIEIKGVTTRQAPTDQEITAYIKALEECSKYYKLAVETPGSKTHRERPEMMDLTIAQQKEKIELALEDIKLAIDRMRSGVPPGGGGGGGMGPGGPMGPGGLQSIPGAPNLQGLNPLKGIRKPDITPLPNSPKKK